MSSQSDSEAPDPLAHTASRTRASEAATHRGHHRRDRSASAASSASESYYQVQHTSHQHHHHSRHEHVSRAAPGRGGHGRKRGESSDDETPYSETDGDGRVGGLSASALLADDAAALRAHTSVGDTRSIVLALRALQDKIRKLEADRDYHQEQCEAARAAHDAYKREVESRLEQDRRDFRRREQDLQAQIATALAERGKIQRTLDESRTDLGHVSGEVSALLEQERHEASGRESRLREELEKYRRELAEERLRYEQMLQQLEQAKAERDILETTNRRLDHTVKDLLAMNKTLVKKTGSAAAAAETTAQRGGKAYGAHVDPAPDSGRATPRGNLSGAQLQQPPLRFQSPTLASLKRNAEGGRRSASAGAANRSTGFPLPLHKQSPPRPAAPTAVHRHDTSTSGTRHTSVPQGGSGTTYSAATQPIDEVYRALDKELRDLNKQYKRVINDANDPGGDMSPEVLTAKLNGIMVQIDRKSEQLRLLRASKADITTEDVRHRPPLSKGYRKATTKGLAMKEMRRMVRGVTEEQ